jgi:Protein of unknown function (DUF4231)
MVESGWNPETYISERVRQYQNWYDRKAVTSKARYLRMRTFSVVAGGLVPVLINIAYDPTLFGIPIIKLVVTLISLLVVISVSLESVLHYREQWKNYRSTEQLLGHEVVAYRSAIGSYRDESPENAFKLLVERVEEAIRAENSATLNVMTMANEPPDDPHKRSVVQKNP